MTFMDSWFFLMEHKIFNVLSSTTIKEGSQIDKALGLNWKPGERIETRNSQFEQALSIVVMESDNGETVIALEAGEVLIDEKGEIAHSHDYDLDVYESTFERAIIKLAQVVRDKFGSDTEGSIVTLDRSL